MSCLESKFMSLGYRFVHLYFTFLTIFFFCHSWRRGLRLRLLHLSMCVPLKSIGVPRRIFSNREIMLSIEG